MSFPAEGKSAEPDVNSVVRFGPFRLDRRRRLLSKEGEPVRLGSRAFDLLVALVERQGQVVSRQDILSVVWRGTTVDEASVRVQVAALRRALTHGVASDRYIVNVAGQGYSFVASIEKAPPKSVAQPAHQRSTEQEDYLPSLPRFMVGREQVVDSLAQLLLARRFVSIVGAGGIGKTTVAVAVSKQLRAQVGIGHIAFVDLGAIAEPEQVLGSIISATRYTMEAESTIADLLAFLADKQMLIVFDSCEHVVDAVSHIVAQIYERTEGVLLLITTRESLRVESETVHLLAPLAYPALEYPTATDALRTPAVQLFMERARLSGAGAELTDENAPLVSEICRRTDGIALAIELAASRVGKYGINGVAELLATNAQLRLVGRRNVAPRHQTLEATLDWSFRLLTSEEQSILCRLSTFSGPFTVEAAGFVVGRDGRAEDVLRIVASLVDKSLVWIHIANDAVLYRLADSTRDYARAKLLSNGEAEAVSRRHAEYFAALFHSMGLQVADLSDVRRHSAHLGNLRRALEWCFGSPERMSKGVQLAADAAPLFLGLWLLAECRYWTGRALGALGGTSEQSYQEARLLEALAVSTMHSRGNTREVRDLIERGLNISSGESSRSTQMRLLAGLNLFLTSLGDFDGALAAAVRCAEVAKKGGAPADAVIGEWMLAAAHHMAGNQLASVEHAEQGFGMEARIGALEVNLFGYDLHLRAELALSRALWLRGAPGRAQRIAIDAMRRAANSTVAGNYSMAALHGVPVLLWSFDVENSHEHIVQLKVHAQRHGPSRLVAGADALRGEWLRITGDHVAAVGVLREAVENLQRDKFHMVIPSAIRALAEALADSGAYDEALGLIEWAIGNSRGRGQAFWLPDLHRVHGRILLAADCRDENAAENELRNSVKLANSQYATALAMRAAIPLARLLISQRRENEVGELLGPLCRNYLEQERGPDIEEATKVIRSVQNAGVQSKGGTRGVPNRKRG